MQGMSLNNFGQRLSGQKLSNQNIGLVIGTPVFSLPFNNILGSLYPYYIDNPVDVIIPHINREVRSAVARNLPHISVSNIQTEISPENQNISKLTYSLNDGNSFEWSGKIKVPDFYVTGISTNIEDDDGAGDIFLDITFNDNVNPFSVTEDTVYLEVEIDDFMIIEERVTDGKYVVTFNRDMAGVHKQSGLIDVREVSNQRPADYEYTIIGDKLEIEFIAPSKNAAYAINISGFRDIYKNQMTPYSTTEIIYRVEILCGSTGISMQNVNLESVTLNHEVKFEINNHHELFSTNEVSLSDKEIIIGAVGGVGIDLGIENIENSTE